MKLSLFLTTLLLISSAHAYKSLHYKGKTKKMVVKLDPAAVTVDIYKKDTLRQTVGFSKSMKTTFIVDHEKKDYLKFDEAKVKSLGQTLDQAMAMMDSLPPAMKAKIKAQMGGMAEKPKSVVKKVASGVKVGKWKTTKYEVREQGKLKSEIWAASYKDTQVSPADFKIFQDFYNFFASSSKTLFKLMKGQGVSAFFSHSKVDGFPVKIKGKTDELLTLEKVDTNKALLNISAPKGYKEKQLM